jgi:hypothetical protein
VYVCGKLSSEISRRDEAADTVCHLPPGTSKWNKIEHHLFWFIAINWCGRPPRSYRTIVHLIAATTTDTGLKLRAEVDENKHPKGVKVSDAEMGRRQPLTSHIRWRPELHDSPRNKALLKRQIARR